jgi:hypothetical protein
MKKYNEREVIILLKSLINAQSDPYPHPEEPNLIIPYLVDWLRTPQNIYSLTKQQRTQLDNLCA